MKTVTGRVISAEPISLSKAATLLSGFTSSDNGASQDVRAYLRRASAAFTELKNIHKEIKSKGTKSSSDTRPERNVTVEIVGGTIPYRKSEAMIEESNNGEEQEEKQKKKKKKNKELDAVDEKVKEKLEDEERSQDRKEKKREKKKKRKSEEDMGSEERKSKKMRKSVEEAGSEERKSKKKKKSKEIDA